MASNAIIKLHVVECSWGAFIHIDFKVNLFAFTYRVFHEDWPSRLERSLHETLGR